MPTLARRPLRLLRRRRGVGCGTLARLPSLRDARRRLDSRPGGHRPQSGRPSGSSPATMQTWSSPFFAVNPLYRELETDAILEILETRIRFNAAASGRSLELSERPARLPTQASAWDTACRPGRPKPRRVMPHQPPTPAPTQGRHLPSVSLFSAVPLGAVGRRTA